MNVCDFMKHIKPYSKEEEKRQIQLFGKCFVYVSGGLEKYIIDCSRMIAVSTTKSGEIQAVMWQDD